VQVAATAAASAHPLPGAVVLFGLYDLNQAQESLVRALIANGADVFVPVPAGAARTALTALEVAVALGLEEQHAAVPPPTRDRHRLRRIWGGAASGEPLGLNGDGSLAVVSVPDERAELREAVRAVLGAVEAGASSWDCALVVPNRDSVELAAAALGEAGLPAACRVADRSTGPRLLVRLADCLSPPAGEPFSRRAVVDLFAAGPLRTGGEAGETAMWLDEARQAGVVAGPGQWTSRLASRRRGLERRLEDLEARVAVAGEDDEDEVSGKADATRRRLAAVRGLENAADALVQACGVVPERVSWGEWAEFFSAAIAAVFAQEAADEARDAASRLHALAVLDERVGIDEATGVLRDLLGGARVPRGRTGRDGVAVLTPLELRGLSFHTVVFTGLAEGGFPARGRPDPLLGDAERRRIASSLGVRLPLAEQRDAESLLLFAFVCEAARERLVLLAPRSGAADGRPRLPSRLLLRLASAAAGRPVGLDEFLEGEPLGPVWRRLAGSPGFSEDIVWVDERERDTALLLALGGGRRAAAASYAAAVLGDGDAVARRTGAWRSARSPMPGPWDGLLGSGARAALRTVHPFDAEMHPTRLERYVSCPFAFLLRDVYGLDAPDEPGDSLEMDAREFGTLAHGILQRAYEQVIREDLRRDGAMAAVLESWEVCCAEAESRGITGAALSWEVRRELLREDLLETVRRDPVFSDPASRPVGVEWRFGESVDRPVVLALPDGRAVRFAGRLDRVDETPSGACIIDYKSGGGGTERNHIKERLSVQLPVYRLAFRQAGEGKHATISCLYRLVTRRGGFEDLDLPQSEAASTHRLQALVATAVALVDAGMFPRTTRQRCEYCDVRYACGVSGWARARKREHELLDPVVGLQSPAAEDDAYV
jgi:ATP-dependent helicase/nuclease subunit B